MQRTAGPFDMRLVESEETPKPVAGVCGLELAIDAEVIAAECAGAYDRDAKCL